MNGRMLRWTLFATVLVSVTWGASGWAAKPSLIRRLSGIRSKPAGPVAEPIQWQADLRSAHRVAASTGRPLLIVVGGPGCTYCRKLEAETLGDASLASYINTSFVPVHLDFDADRRAVEILEVKALPTCIVLSPKVDLLATVEGYIRPPEFTKALHQAIDYQRRLQAEEQTAR